MAGKSYARSKRHRRNKQRTLWHKGKIRHELDSTVKTIAHMNRPGCQVKLHKPDNVAFESRVGVKRVNRLSEVRQPSRGQKIEDFTIISAWDGPMEYPVQYELGYQFSTSNLVQSEEREKELRKMTREAYRQIRAMEAHIWVGRSEAPANHAPCDIRHSRPPHWTDWKPAKYHLTPVRDGDGIGQSPIRPKAPPYSVPYGTGLDVESRAQMSARFEEFISTR